MLEISVRTARIASGMALECVPLATIGFLPATGMAFAQSASDPAARPAFEVATVKRSTDPITAVLRVEHGNFTYGNGLRLLIGWAYGVSVWQVVAPDWAMTANTVVSAKAGHPVSDDEVRLMAQTLLEDRFKLRVHRETKETLVAALTVAGRNAAQMKESESLERHLVYDSEKQQEIVTGYTMKEFVEWLAQFYKGAIDRTGMPGRYDFVLDYRHLGDPSDPEALALPGVRLKLRPEALEQMGLKIAAVRTPLEFVVVDHVEKVPTEN